MIPTSTTSEPKRKRKPKKIKPPPCPVRIYNRNNENDSEAVYVGRPSRWGNPFDIGPHGTRGMVLIKFEEYLLANPALLEAAKRELKGRPLSCWCAPRRCHAEILARYANEDPE